MKANQLRQQLSKKNSELVILDLRLSMAESGDPRITPRIIDRLGHPKQLRCDRDQLIKEIFKLLLQIKLKRPGRPRNEKLRQRVMQLRSEGKSWTRITQRLNRETGSNLTTYRHLVDDGGDNIAKLLAHAFQQARAKNH